MPQIMYFAFFSQRSVRLLDKLDNTDAFDFIIALRQSLLHKIFNTSLLDCSRLRVEHS